uniref:four helix bundle protein n=1 Tax=Prevotella sp. TaxID=59823 RepID=UPI0040291981
MSEFGNILEDKCMNFSIRIVNLCHFLNEKKHEFNIANQMFRSGTSIGANIAEAQCAVSRNDFISKLYISLKESNETLYWLRLLYKTRYINKEQFSSIYNDCDELKRILMSATKNARANLAQEVQRNDEQKNK